MIEIFNTDMFDIMHIADAIAITTNSSVYNSKNVMGGGCAREAVNRWPQIAHYKAAYLNVHGNKPCLLGLVNKKNNNYLRPSANVNLNDYTMVWSFPTKNEVQFNSDIELIKQSCEIITNKANKYNLNKILTVRLGSGLGGLDWNYVKPIIEPLLDDRFFILHKDGK